MKLDKNKDFCLSSACLQHTEEVPVLVGMQGYVMDEQGKPTQSSDAAELYKAYTTAKAAGELFKLIITVIPHRNGMNNANFWRVEDSQYRKVMATAVDGVFIRDHAVYEGVEVRGGKILSSKVKGKGEEAFVIQEIELSKPWAIEDALIGNMDRFSIQLNRENVYCSVCGQRVWDNNNLVWEWCHMPGRVYDIEGKGKVTAWWIAGKGTTFLETSTVLNPAVPDTGTKQIEQLAAACGKTITLPFKEETMTLEELQALLASKEEELKAKDDELLRATKAMGDATVTLEKAAADLKAEKDAHGATLSIASQAQRRLCFDLVDQIAQVRAGTDLFAGQDAVALAISEDADLPAMAARETQLRCTLLADQILVERDRRDLDGNGATEEEEQANLKAERERLMTKAPELLAELLSEVRLTPIPRAVPPAGRGAQFNPTEANLKAERQVVLDAAGVEEKAKPSQGIDEFSADSIAGAALAR